METWCWCIYKCLDGKWTAIKPPALSVKQTGPHSRSEEISGRNMENVFNNDENINSMLVFVEAESHMYA